MSYSRDSTVQLIKETADIVEIIGECVTLKRAGSNLKGRCPFHSEKTPSFMVNPERRIFHCFGCGEGGDVFAFVMKYHGLTFPEAVKDLADRYRITLPEKPLSSGNRAMAERRDAMFKVHARAAEIYHDYLIKDAVAEPARQYLAKRGLSSETIDNFYLGYAPERWDFLVGGFKRAGVSLEAAEACGLIVKKENSGYYDRFRGRILFPIRAMTGKIVGFGGRVLGNEEPKYLNSPESMIFNKGNILFGAFQTKHFIRQEKICVIVEGNFDLLSLFEQGIKNVAAPLGTALTRAQVRSIKGYADEIILLFDGDAAGLKAAMRAVPLFLTEELPAGIVLLPEGEDPDSIVRREGKDGLLKRFAKALPLPEFVFGRLVDQYGMTLEGKAQIAAGLRPIIEAIGDMPLQRDLFVSHFSKQLGLTSEQLLDGYRQGKSPPPVSPGPSGTNKINLSYKQRQLLEFLVIYPEYLNKFMENGLEDVISDAGGLVIINQLKKIAEESADAGPESLLDVLESGPERSFVSRLLMSAPFYPDDVKEAVAEEMMAWLEKNHLKKERERLNKLINDAQRARDETLYMELIKKKKEMDELFVS